MKKIIMTLVLVLMLAVPTQSLAAVQFNDVTDRTQNGILEKLVAEGLVSGTSAKTFTPNRKVTRGEMAVFLNRAFDLKAVRPAGTFKDVPKTHKYYSAIQSLYRADIINGAEGKFMPSNPVTREQIAIVFTRLLNLNVEQTTKFKDVPKTHVSNMFVGALVAKGITSGYTDGTFKPKTHVTRMQFSTFLYRSLYGKEPVLANRKITSLSKYSATKLSYAKYKHNFFNETDYVSFNILRNGDSEFKDWDINMRGLSVYVEGSDWVFFNLYDIEGMEENKVRTQKITDMNDFVTQHTEKTKVIFDQPIKVDGKTFTNALKVTSTYSYGSTWTFYVIEGYGIVKVFEDEKVMWELVDYDLR